MGRIEDASKTDQQTGHAAVGKVIEKLDRHIIPLEDEFF